jgi:transcriptional regulatory protein LevR
MFSVERLVKKNTKFEYRNTKKIEEKEKKTKKILDFKFEIRNYLKNSKF